MIFQSLYSGSATSGVYIKNSGSVLSRVFDGDTPMPGFGLTLAAYGETGDVNANGTVVFRAQATDGVTDGVYTGTAGGSPTIVGDENTTVPGVGFGFARFLTPVSIDADGKVVFIGSPSNNISTFSLYLRDGSTISRLAGLGDAIFGKSETLTRVTNFAALRNGNAAFLGTNTTSGSSGQGIYQIIGGIITPLVDQDTSVPGGGATFQSYSMLSFDGDRAVFLAFDSSGKLGVYLFKDGALTRIADTTTPVPGTSDPFLFFSGASIDGDRVVFHGVNSAGGIQGLYYYRISDQILVKLIDEHDQLGGMGIRNLGGLAMQHNGLSGSRVGFPVFFDDQSQAIYVAKIDDNLSTGPKVTLNLGVGEAGEEVRIAVQLTNETSPPVGGLQMAVVTEHVGDAQFSGIEDHTNLPDFSVVVNEFTPGTVNFVVASDNKVDGSPWDHTGATCYFSL